MKKGSLLLVEDNPDDEALVVRSLQRLEFVESVTVARDGEEAIERLIGNGSAVAPSPPTVVLLDIKLNGRNGLDVLAAVRENRRTRHLPVVMFTSSDEESDRARTYELGANSYVCKPLSLRELKATIAMLGEYWVRKNQPPPDVAHPGAGSPR